MPNALLARPGLIAYGLLAASAVFTTPGRGWWLAITVLMISIGLGRALLGSLSTSHPEAPAHTTLGALVGLWAILLATIALGSFHALNLWTGIGVLGIAAIPAIRNLVRQPPPPFPWSAVRWPHIVLCVVAFALAEAYLVRSLLPDSDWDGALYHLPMAKNFVDLGIWAEGIRPAALYRPGTVQALYALFHAVETPSAAIPVNMLAVLGAAWMCYQIGATFWNRATGGWAAAVFLSSCLVWEYGVDVRVEPFLMLFFLYALFGGMLFFRDRTMLSLGISGMGAGLMAGTKYNGLLFAAFALVPVGVALLVHQRSTPGKALKMAGIALALFMIPGGIFYARNAVIFSNPVHPYLSASKGMKWNPEEIIGERWSKVPATLRPTEDLETALDTKKQLAGRGNPEKRSKALVLYNAVMHPQHHNTKPFHWLSPWVLGFVLIPIFRRDRRSLWFWGFAAGSYALAIGLLGKAGDFPIRYLAPLIPTLAIGTALCLSRATHRILIAVLAVGVAAPLAYGAWQQQNYLSYLRPDRYLFGKEDESFFLSRVGFNGALIDPNTQAIRFVNTAIPRMRRWIDAKIARGEVSPDAMIYMIAEAKTGGVPIRCIPSNDATGRGFLIHLKNANWDFDVLAKRFWERGIRYIFVNRDWMYWSYAHAKSHKETLLLTLSTLSQFLPKHCKMPVSKLEDGAFIAELREPK